MSDYVIVDTAKLPDGWGYREEHNTVECQCMFRFGAEHMKWDGTDTCPACAEMNAIVEIERLRKALAEIVIRTMPYQDDHEGWPLVAGVHRVAHDALAETKS